MPVIATLGRYTYILHKLISPSPPLPQVEADEKLLNKLGGILMTNAFEARGRKIGSHVRCLFPDAGLLAHSCLPNVHHTIDHTFTIYLRAAEPIKKVRDQALWGGAFYPGL